MNSGLSLPSAQCEAWASTCHSSVPGCATPYHDCDRSARVSRYIGQSPGTPSMGTRGQACGLVRKWRIIHWVSRTQPQSQPLIYSSTHCIKDEYTKYRKMIVRRSSAVLLHSILNEIANLTPLTTGSLIGFHTQVVYWVVTKIIFTRIKTN